MDFFDNEVKIDSYLICYAKTRMTTSRIAKLSRSDIFEHVE